MPYLRFSRDIRGYEHTYVLHGLGSGSRPRLLYWFRTPPNVTVGRLPLDEEAIRLIEACNPDLTFDWTKMTATPRPRQQPAAEAKQEEASSGRGRRSRRAGAPPSPPVGPPDGAEPVDAGPLDAGPVDAGPVDAEPGDPEEPATEDLAPEAGAAPGMEDRGEAEALELEADALEDDHREGGDLQDDPSAPERRHPVAALLGDDALVRMRARYAELRARLADSPVDGDARTSLAARIEDLNPDHWRAGEEVVLGIERFDAEAAAIRAALGRRRHSAPFAEPPSK